MTFVWLGIAVGVVVIINEACERIAAWMDRPLSDFDLYCSSVDRELDERAAQRALRPHTDGCEVIQFPRTRERTRGDA